MVPKTHTIPTLEAIRKHPNSAEHTRTASLWSTAPLTHAVNNNTLPIKEYVVWHKSNETDFLFKHEFYSFYKPRLSPSKQFP